MLATAAGAGTGKAPVALVTGVRRGLGKATALALADAGFDVAVTARTVSEGVRRAEDDTVKGAPPIPLAGSLDTTVAEIERSGRRGLGITMDSGTSRPSRPLLGGVPMVGAHRRARRRRPLSGAPHLERVLDLRMADLDTLIGGTSATRSGSSSSSCRRCWRRGGSSHGRHVGSLGGFRRVRRNARVGIAYSGSKAAWVASPGG